MKLRLAAIIMTTIVLIVGVAMISPLFLSQDKAQPKQEIMLSFSVLEVDNAVEWCQNLSAILDSYNMEATVFFVGKTAEKYPQAITCFGERVDIGSQTYSNMNLTAFEDYSLKLQEVQQGKAAVDNAGNVNSMVFYAPYGAADQDIYSLLSRSGFLADFSYKNQYNVYLNGQFIKFNATVLEAIDCSPEFFLTRPKTSEPVIIHFDSVWSSSDVESFLGILRGGDFEFVNASQLAGFDLTNRGT